ncbi:SH3 domain-containing protein [Fictibacillus sp. JL2B1089]|uniref:SH3 domain-containing protein n=1 Tax=Fictibacillus sp. JL2B1089 TaxID=3399565 RepID=UPI003A83FDA8
MKRFIASSLVITSAISPLTVNAQTKPSNMIANADYVNVRKGATTSYEVITRLKKGQTVKIIDQFTNQKKELWYKVDLGNNKGWVISNYLTINKNEVKLSPSKKEFFSLSNKTSLRKGASISYSIVENLKEGQQVIVLEHFKNKITGENWIRIQSEKNVGWIQEKYIMNNSKNSDSTKTESTMYIKALKANVHKGATDTYKVVFNLDLNTEVKVVDTFINSENEKWSRIKSKGTYGWIRSEFLSDVINETTLKKNSIKYMFVSQQNLLVRKGAAIHYPSITSLKLNQKVNIIDEYSRSGEVWYRLQLTSSTFGWVPARSLSSKQIKKTKITVKVTSAIVRSGASTSYKKIASLQKGKSFTVIDTFINSKNETWYRIEYKNKRYGWISSSVVSGGSPAIKTISKYVGTKNAYVYRGADLGYKTVTKLPYSEKIIVLGEFTNKATGHKWLNIRTSKGTTGWTPSWELYNSLNSIPMLYSISSTRLFKGASTTYTSAGTITAGTPIIKLSTANDWYHVETITGVRGWVQKNNVSINSPKGLLNPVITKVNSTTHHIKWNKSSSIGAIKYTLPASNQILISGDIASIELPARITGVSSTKQITNTNGTKSLLVILDSNYTFTLRSYDSSLDLKIMSKGIQGKKIIVDAGHGDYDPGAIGPSGVKEKDVNLAVAKYLKAELERYGATVLLTRSKDVYLELSERTDISNKSDYDAFVSIHSNAYSAASRGTETFYNTSKNFNASQSRFLAQDVQAALSKELGTHNRGYTNKDFYVTRENDLPSILVELAFISNPKEEKLLKSDRFRRDAATGIRTGLQNFFK